jgi:hypothetical protein
MASRLTTFANAMMAATARPSGGAPASRASTPLRTAERCLDVSASVILPCLPSSDWSTHQ